MEEYCQNQFCDNKAVKEVPVSVEKPSDRTRSLCTTCEEVYTWGVQHGKMICEGLKIEPPPEETGDEPLFRVVYVIDVSSRDVCEAARYTHRIMTDPGSLAPVLQVIDSKGNSTEIDLSEDDIGCDEDTGSVNYEATAQYLADQGKQPVTDLFTKTTVGFVIQTFRKNSKGRYICTHQEFIAGDQCDYEDIRGNTIEPPDYEYQPYNMVLRVRTPDATIQAERLTNAYDAIEEVLKSLDVGGEQSRQFAEEIKILRDVTGHR
jgi:hypothetical protein